MKLFLKHYHLLKFFKVMRLTFLFFIIALVQVAATGYSQSINLDVNNMEIRQVIKNIEQQSDYRFFYTDGLTDLSRRVDLNLTNQPIEQVLLAMLDNTQLGYQVVENKLIMLIPKGILQQITITGKVTDASGEPLPGVTVMVKGTTQGTATDANGAFSLPVPDENAVLAFSFIGFVSQEMVVGNRRTINVTLIDDTRQLEEVVVVGYGALKKVNLTGAVIQLKGDVLENRPVRHIAQALQGQVANLNILPNLNTNDGPVGGAPGSSPAFNIRGYTGLGSLGAPLLIIDGVQGGNLNTVNMNDVESISVLKDAASTAIYGSSAPFGVIIINTKKGGRDKRPTITYNNFFGFAQVINMPKMANAYDFANIWNEASINAGGGVQFTPELVQAIKETVEGKRPPFRLPADPRPGYDEWDFSFQHGNTNWLDFYFKKSSFQQQHNVGVSGGSDRSSYYLGLGYNDQNGMYNFADESYRQFRVRANLSSDVTKWLTVSFRGNFSRGMLNNPTNMGNLAIDEITRKWPNWATHNEQGWWGTSSIVPTITDGGRNLTDTDWATLTGEFVIKPLPGWDITGNYTLNGTYVNQLTHYRTTYNMRPSGEKFIWTNATNRVDRNFNKNQHHAVNLFTSYEKQFGDHFIKALAGYTQELYDDLRVTTSNTNLYANDIPSLAQTYNPTRSASDDASQLAIRGGFGRINYNYREKYLIELNGRYDGTSRFLNEVRNKFYPGISAGWVLSKESFWGSVEDYINMLKLRVSYGQLGDQGFTGRYPFYPSMAASPPTGITNYPNNWLFSDGRQSYITNPGLINQNLTWITTTTLDFGADLSLLNQRLNVNFDWYKRLADDYVGPAVRLPSFLGASQPQVNNSSLETKGYDITIGWEDRVLGNELHYNASLVFSDFKTVVTKFPNPTGLINTWYEGQVIGSIWGYKTEGLFQSQAEIDAAPSQSRIYATWTPGDVRYKDLNGDGEIWLGNQTLDNPGDKTIIGNTTPRYTFGLTLAADYKGIDFSVFAQGVGKRDFFTESNLYWGVNQGGAYNDSWQQFNEDNRWKPDNPNGFFPKYYHSAQMTKNMQVCDRYLINAAYMRIKNMQLGYTIPTNLTGKINCQRARIFMSVENLATVTKMLKSFDPEFLTIDSASTSTSGRSGGKIYPLQRTWSFGLNVTF